MNTQQAIAFLTNKANTLTQSLTALGLGNNGETVTSLQTKVDQAVKTAFGKREQLSSKLDTLTAQARQAENELSLAVGNQSIEQERLAELQRQQQALEITIKDLQERRQVLSDNGDSKKAAIKAEIAAIKANITKTEAEVAAVKQQIADGLALVASYDSLRQQAQTAQEKANYHNQFVQYWGVVGQERGRSGKTKDIYGWITNTEQVNARNSFQAQANQFTKQATAIQGQVDSFKQSLSILEQTKNSKTDQVWLYYQELDAKNNILSFVSTQSGNDLALLDLQLSQLQTDLVQLKNTDIPSQKTITDGTTQRVAQAQSELEQFKAQKLSAQKDLDGFNQSNKELLTTDLSLDLLQDLITKSQAKVTSLQGDLAKPNQSTELIDSLTQALSLEQAKLGQLKQQYQLEALEVLAVNQDRLESLKGQLAAEGSVGAAVKETTIGGYVVLVSQFAQQLTGLSDIWAESLKENHQFTVEVSNLFDSNLTAFVGVKQFIEDNLALPYSDYVLNGIQLDEALAIQETQVKYRDLLAKTVDDLQENIELQKKSVEQTDLLSVQLTHIVTLRSLETQYTTLGNQASTSLRFQLVDILDKEIANKTQDLPNQIDLPNDQQEAFIETTLQKYLQNKQKTVFNFQEKQLSLLRETFQQPTRALYFDGVNDYVNVGVKPSLKVTTNLTLEAWINPQQDARTRMIVGREGEYLLALSGADNIIHYAVANSNPGWTWISTGYSVKSNQWSHVAFSFDNGQIKTYVNGQLIYKYDGVGTIGDANTNQNELRIGNRQWNNTDLFKGQIDEVRVWNVTRNQAEIQTFYNRNLNGTEQGLAGYWNFEESTGDKVNDLTVNNNQGTLTNGVQRTVDNLAEVKYQPSRSLYFDGINDYVNVGIKPSLKVTTNLTLEAWINPQQDSRIRTIVGREGEYLLALSGADNIIHYAVANSNPGWTWISTGYSVKSNQWSHVAFSFDNGQIKTYVNGQLIYKYDGVGTIGDVYANQNELRIGNRQWNNNSEYFKGQIDEVRVWNVTRNQAEIQTFYNRNLNGTEQGLAGYWNFEESTGDKVNDLTINNNQGTLTNGVQRTVDNLAEVKYQPSRSLYFDGINDYVNVGIKPSLKVSTNLTLEAWIKPQAKGNNGLIISREGEYLLSVGSDNQIYYAVANANPRWTWIGTGYTVSVNQWTHIAFTYNNGEIKLYGNGKLAYYYQGSGAIGDAVTSQDELRIGNRQSNNSEFFKGEIDEVKVWNTTRTQAEIQANLSQKLTGTEQGLVGYWNFEETSGQIVTDSTANGNHGMLMNRLQRNINTDVVVNYQPTRTLYFDGVNDYVNVGIKPSLKVTTNLTIEAWINPQQDSRTRMIVGREGEYLLALSGGDNIIHYAVANSNPGWTWISTGYSVKSNQWSHVAFSFDNGQIKTYVNGQLVYTYDGVGTIGDANINQNELRIGNRQWNNTDLFKGQIDEVRVWNVTRNQAEIQTFYNRNLNGTEQGLAGYWNFEESSGNTVNDLTINNNQGMLTNGVQRTVDNLAEVKYQPSRSLYFDGINDYVNVGIKPSLKVSTNLTLEAWIKPQAKGNNGLIISREGEYLLSVGSDNQIYYAIANTNPRWTWIGTGYTVSVNQWTHIAFTYNNGEIKLYGNGKLAYYYQGSGAIGDAVTSQDELRIGNRQSNNSEFFKGEIDEVRVWNTTRTQAEIQTNLSQKLTGTEQGLVGYWNFEESTGDKVNDLTANNNQGTLTNGVQRTVDSSVAVPKVLDEQTNITYDKTITELEKLRLEIAHLNLQAEKNPNKVQQFLQEYEASNKNSTTLQTLRDKYFPELNQAKTLAALQTQINNEIGQSQQQIEQLKASITQKQAQSAAALSQAQWYEQQAATHWQLSHKAGPTWTEERTAKGKSGTSKTVTVTHVDHNWIIWDTYSKQAISLREQAANLLKGITTDTTNQNTANDILKQWQEASAVADQTALTQADLTALLNQLNADRQLNGDKKQQIADWEKLLPTLQSQLQKAITDAQTAKANTTKEWTEYQTSQDQYQNNLADVLTRRAQLQSQGQLLLQEIDNVDEWVNQQNTLLSDEIGQVKALITQLNTQKAAIPSTLSNDQTLTLKALIDQSLQLLTQKQIVLTAQQSTFTQKQTLLENQKKVIQTQYDLLDAYLENPDKDTTNLEKLLADTSKTLAEVKKLAEQAEASSNALTVLMDDVQVSLLLQNDKYLSVIKDKQKTLQDLLAATELKENDTLKATQKQIELNGLQTQLLDVLKKANDAGSQEAAALLKVAESNNFVTVAELYHRDYQDLAADNGGRCSGGIARPEDIQLANYYYNEMLKYRQLKTEAEQQVAQFTQLRTLAESQVTALKAQETLAAQELAALKQSIGNSQEQINAKQEELGIAQFRVDALLQLRNWTEQTQVQLLTVEQLNLAQAKLEQDIANNRQYLIDNTVKAQLDQQRLSIERDRQIAVVKLEQLNQLKTEEALQTAINNLRDDLGVNPITEIIQLADYKGQLAGVLADIETLKQKQPSLPATTKTLLDSTIKDIHAVLQGKETQTIQENLLNSANALIEQSNKLKTEVAKLQQEEQGYVNLLTQSQTDLKGATKTLYDEIQKSGVLDSEKTLLNDANLQVLYQIGYAQGAVDLSSALAKQSKDILEQVINGRIEERKAREKAAFNEIFSTVTLVISAVAAVLTAGASLAANAASILGVSTTTISSLATTLKTLSATLSIFQAAYNGDWSTVIFKTGLALVGGLKDIAGLSDTTVTALQTSINTAYVAYKGGDSIGILLSAIQGAGAIAANGVNLTDLSKVSELKTFLITASQISNVVRAGVQAIENGDVLKGIQALGQSLGTISKNFGLGLEEAAKAKLENLTGLDWQKLDQIIDVGGDAYKAIQDKDWINLVKSIGGTVKILDKDFALETENQGKTALKQLTGLEWSEFEQIVDASKTLEVAIKTKNITDISAALNQLANVWVSDDKLNSSLVKAISLDWQDLTDVAKTADVLIPAIRNDNTEAWVKASSDFLKIWDSNAAFKKTLKDTTKLEWTEFKQLVTITQTTAIAIDQRSINAWVDVLKNTLDLALKDTSFDNTKVKQIITTAQQTNNTNSWVTAVDQLLGVAKDATALRNKLGGITGVSWAEFKQIINAGQAISTAIDNGKFTNWRDALKTTLNIWVDDATLQQKIVTTTGLKWEELTRIGSTYEALRKAEQKGDATSWLQAADQVLTLWESNSTFTNKVKTLTSLDWQKLKDLVAIGKTVDTAIDQNTYDTWRNALKQTVNFWVTDQTLNKSLESLIGLNWGQLDKIGLASDALYKAYDKAEQIIDKTLDSNSYKAWLNGIEDVYKLWKDDPILRQKVTDAGKVIWSELDGVFTAQGTLNTNNSQDKIKTSIEDTINTLETTFQQKLESTIGLSWTQVKAVAQSGEIIAKAIGDNKTDQWIQASDKILGIWEKDSELRQVLKDKYKIDWTNIKASVSSGQNLAKAIQTNTVPAWGTALQNIINIWAETATLTTQQKDKLQQTNNLVKQVKASNNSQDWLTATNQILDLWKNETAFQTQLQQNNQLSWQDISNSVKSGQLLSLQQNGLQQWLGNLKDVVDLWKADPEIKTIVENVSDFNWQSLNNIINYNNLTVNFINGDNNNNSLLGTAKNDYIDVKNGNETLNGGAGIDTLIGGLGDDIYVVDTTTDTITELANEGIDTIQSSVSFSLSNIANVENLTLLETMAINGTGDALNNAITGNSAANILTGGGGKDTLIGGLGSDRFDYKTLTDSLLANFDVITDFNANASNDLLLVTTARSSFTNAGAVATLDNTGITAQLTTANFGANSAAGFTFGSRTFVAINDATAGFNETTDAIIEINGLTGTLGLTNFVTV